MHLFVIFCYLTKHLNTQHILFINNNSNQKQNVCFFALLIRVFYNTTKFPINIRFFFSLKTKWIASTIIKTLCFIFKCKRKNQKQKVKTKYDGLKMQNVCLFQQSLFWGIYKVHRFKQAKYLTLPPLLLIPILTKE